MYFGNIKERRGNILSLEFYFSDFISEKWEVKVWTILTCECGKISKTFKRDISLISGSVFKKHFYMLFWLDIAFKIMYLKYNEVLFLYFKIQSKIEAKLFKFLHYEPRRNLFTYKIREYHDFELTFLLHNKVVVSTKLGPGIDFLD
jgi:hypothetical protein